ncbi:hypothetical protein M9H77_26186 [Catharanthus roseus]|uniref:Uncharacterized protein n=1 Tax=Catharanthus roseus TaxID=4058 RepID=A0ACC0ABM8_CATRO|nr:hypothetical protein M9H77_26186 [Catharanthus roseus]
MTRLFLEAKRILGKWMCLNTAYSLGVMASYLGPFGFYTYSQVQSQPPVESPISMLNLAGTRQTLRSAFSSTVVVLDIDDDNDDDVNLTNEEANNEGIDGGTRDSGSRHGVAAKGISEKVSFEGV